jgi:hypothetical protein
MSVLQQIYVPHIGVENLHVGEALITLANQQQPEAVTLCRDITQRAHPDQFCAERAFPDRFGASVLSSLKTTTLRCSTSASA